MAIKSFIPTIWSETLYRELDKKYIAIAHCNRDYEGDIRACGDTVRIAGLNPISVYDYTKNQDMKAPEELSGHQRDLVINQAKYFNFLIDDVERAQSNPDAMQLAMNNAAAALANAADKYVYNLLATDASAFDYEAGVTVDNILEKLIEARTKLYERNVSESAELFLEVSPAIAEMIYKAKINLSTDNSELVETGCIGSICGCKVFVSNNIVLDTESSDSHIKHVCILRTKRAVTFAEQLSEIDAYRPELRFADAVKGLHLYGAKVVYPNELLRVNLDIDLNA